PRLRPPHPTLPPFHRRASRRRALAAPLLLAALAPAQGFPHNELEHTNWWLDAREDLFPNFLAQGGNVAGDALFKVLPVEVLERDGDLLVSGYRVTISVDDAYTGRYPAI